MRAKHRISGLLAAGLLAALGVGGAFGATSAMAEEEKTTEQCLVEFEEGTKAFKGEGSSLQKIAQEIWTGVKGTKGFNVNSEGCAGSRGAKNKTKVAYTSDGSAAGLEAWGVNKVAGKTPASSKDIFVGTDDAPNAAQLKEIDEAAKGASGKGQALVVPVAQASVAIIANPPTGCELTSNHLTNKDLQAIFADTLTKWNEISTKKETVAKACETSITRVVRHDGSGTTYQFKHYLFEINKNKLKATKAGEPERTWEELQPETTRNLEWPEESTVVRAPNNGGGELVKKTYETAGSIGYANLGDARAGIGHSNFTWAAVENQKTTKFEFPGVSSGEPSATGSEANCEGTSYTGIPATVGPDDDWSSVYGGHPKTNEHYPICTLTWDVALKDYTVAEYAPNPHNYGQTAFDYLNYVVAPKGGQEDFLGNDYLGVEKAVKTYAREEAALIN